MAGSGGEGGFPFCRNWWKAGELCWRSPAIDGYVVASERAKEFALIYPDAKFEVTPPELAVSTDSRDDALLAMIKGWMMHSGPTSAAALAFLLGTSCLRRHEGSAAHGGKRVGTARQLYRPCYWQRT